MADKYPHGSRKFDKFNPGARPTGGQNQAIDNFVQRALNDIDNTGTQGPLDPAGAPLFPGWMDMTTEERKDAVINAIDADPNFQNSVGQLRATFAKRVFNAYEEEHRHNP